jgi:hypothetical protein
MADNNFLSKKIAGHTKPKIKENSVLDGFKFRSM